MGQGGFCGFGEFDVVGEFFRSRWLLWSWLVFAWFGEFMGLGCAGLLVMAASSNQNTLRNSRVRFIPYRRRAFSVPNISPVPEKVLRQISCCQVKQVWKILIQRSRSEARPYILLLIYFILLFRPSISPLLIEYFMAFLMGEMSRWTLFTKLTTSP